MGHPRSSKPLREKINGEIKQKIKTKIEKELHQNHKRFDCFREEEGSPYQRVPHQTKTRIRITREIKETSRIIKKEIKRGNEES